MDRAAIESLIHKCYEARRKNDLDVAMTCFHADANFHMAGPDTLAPMTNRLMGHTQMREAFSAMFPAWDWSRFLIERILIDGDRAVVHSKGTLTFTPTGKSIDTQIVDLIRFEDDRIVDFIEFCDTLSAARMTGATTA
jgi:ketosteroid isomerase-like protein